MNEIQKVVKSKEINPRDLAMIAQIAGKSMSCVSIEKAGLDYVLDAKSILGIFSLGIKEGDVIIFKSDDASILSEISEVRL